MKKEAVIVGAGLTGITCARILADKGYRVDIVERRNHIGGNCFDSILNGVTVHNYGPHIFRTNSEDIYNFISRFTCIKHFRHVVWGRLNNNMLIPIPFNRKSMEILGESKMPTTENLKAIVFNDYSEKQWGMKLSELPKSIQDRVPLCRNDYEDRYSLTEYYGVPSRGYTDMLEWMMRNDDITCILNSNDSYWRTMVGRVPIIYTGMIDEYFMYCHGRLGYRSLDMVHRTAPRREFAIINECNRNVAYTRSYDHSHFLDEKVAQTIITEEYPCAYNGKNIPFYPIPTDDNIKLYDKYRQLADKEPNVMFIGRLAEYSYMDMDVAIGNAFKRMEEMT